MPRTYRVALVEGDDLMRDLVARWLREARHVVIPLSLAELLERSDVDILLLDVPTPRSALPLIATVRAVHDLPIVLLSARLGRNQAGSRDLARQLGVRSVLGKPFTKRELRAALEAT